MTADEEKKVRSSVEDALNLLRRLGPLCQTVDELVGILELALTNPAQLRLVLKEALAPRR